MEKQLEILKEASHYIQRLYEGITKAIECFRNEELSTGYNIVAQISEGIEWLSDVFRLTQQAQVEKLDTDGLEQLLSSIINAIENKDENLLADILEFELIEKVQIWKAKLAVNVEHYNL